MVPAQSEDEDDDDDEAERREIEMERQYRRMRMSSVYSIGSNLKSFVQNPKPAARKITTVDLVCLKP